MQGNASLSVNQEKLIQKLLAGQSIAESAKELKINESTAHRWLKDTAFQQSYNDQRQRLLNHSITTLQLKFDNAVQTLDKHTKSPKTIPRDQIRASEIIVDKTLQTAKLIERISELEARLAEQEQDLMYKVVFDLRKLTRAERASLEAIEQACAEREQTTE